MDEETKLSDLTGDKGDAVAVPDPIQDGPATEPGHVFLDTGPGGIVLLTVTNQAETRRACASMTIEEFESFVFNAKQALKAAYFYEHR